MERVIAIFLSCVLLSASDLLASSAEETYQAALTQEKGEGNLEEAIRLYQQVIEAHEKGEGDENMAARAQLRIGVCQEKLGLAQARQTYEAVRDKYPDQPQVGAEAARRLGSTHQREAVIEEPSHRTASESYIRRQLQQIMERAKRQMEAIQRQITEQTKRQIEQVKQLTEQTKQRMEQAKRGTGADSVFIDEQVRRQLEAAQRQMEQVERQLEAIQRRGFRFERIRPRHFLEGGSDQRYYHYANTPPVIPYAYEEVAEVPIQWKFRLDESEHPQRHRYATLDLDDSDWATINIGQAYEDQGYAGYDGWAWYRATFTVAADSVRSVLMAFGGVGAKDAFVYVNGHLVGQHYDQWDRPFILDISDHVVRDGENAVALYLYDDFGMGGVYGLINVHQPTNEAETDDLAANRGGRLNVLHDWPPMIRILKSGERYNYAHRPPRIPYPHQTVAEVPMQWKFCLDVGGLDPQRHREYANPDFDDSEWADISIGQAWENQGYVQYDEGAWYRTRIEVDAEKGRPVLMAFGGVDKDAYVYINGNWVGEHHEWNQPFILDISDYVVRDGENTVALYVYDGTLMGGVYGLINVHQPIGEENLDRYLVNGGGSAKRSFWSRFF